MSGEVHADDYYRALYSTDASIYQIRPLAVVVPRSAADVRATIAWAAEHRWPIVPAAAAPACRANRSVLES